mgnify:CR=1 FL=1
MPKPTAPGVLWTGWPDAGVVGEIDQRELTHILGRNLPLDRRQNLAAGVDRDGDGVRRDGDARPDRIAVGRYDFTGGAELKGPGAAIGRIAVWQGHLKEALALDGKIVSVVGRDKVALFGNSIDGGGFNADADLNPVVFMFAILLEMTSTLSCWASMPVAAILSDLMILLPV